MSTLTKEELRNALIAHGVTDLPPASAKKEELVSLYEEHVAPTANGSAEFSSDDEVYLNSSPSKRASAASKASKASNSSKVSKSGSKSPKKKMANGDSMVVEGVDIDALDDDELFEKLKENGVDVGPIVASTRPFYKKKLAMVLRGETLNGTNGNGAEYSDNDTDPETEPEEEKTPASRKSTRRSASSKHSTSSQSPKKSPTKSPLGSMINNLSGLRQRVANDETDTGKLTPTPRRSIHSYKVTETTKQTITKNRDGTETKDVFRKVERMENGKVVGEENKGKVMAIIIKVVLFVAILAAIYFVVLQSDGTVTLDQIEDAVNSAAKSSADKAQDSLPPPEKV